MSIREERWNPSAILIPAVLCLYGCGLCQEEILQQLPNAGGTTVATLYVRDCGATTDFASMVHLRFSSRSFDGSDASGIVMDAKGRHQVELRWQPDASLLIRCTSCKPKDILTQKTNWYGIHIDYATAFESDPKRGASRRPWPMPRMR
jgi:hypothetical protein